MRVVIVGTGKIGCGALAPLFADAGWDVVMAARTRAVAQRIRSCGGWLVQVTGPRGGGPRWVPVADAVAVGDDAFGEAVAAADLVCVSVGVGNVAATAAPLARALAGRVRPVDVWVVENADQAPSLRTALAACGTALPPVGIAGVVASVAVGRGRWTATGPAPCFVGDDARTLWVDGTALVTPPPTLPGVRATRHYRARLVEKLYVFNAGHAVCAYLGALRGHETVPDAVSDPLLRPIIVGCLLEARRAVLAAHPELVGEPAAEGVGPHTADEVHAVVGDALRRFADRELADPIERVAREPIRKLGADDRLLGPARLIRAATGRVPAHFALAVAGALLYPSPDDEQAVALRRMLRRQGLVATLGQVCGLAPDDELTAAIEARYRGFILTPEGTIFPPVHTTDALLAPRLAAPEADLAGAPGMRGAS
ncbi:MAG TPA: hypothetical protein VM324_05320 [Egibacteraceae bacterium]|nr:hypothetical protein [Egibacteraceae bacterium]